MPALGGTIVAMDLHGRSVLPHPLLDWSECIDNYTGSKDILHVLGVSLIFREVNVKDFPGIVLVHPRRVSRLKVNDGGTMEAWEPLDPPITSCIGKPIHQPIWQSRPSLNPLNSSINLSIPRGENTHIYIHAKPLRKIIYNEIDPMLHRKAGELAVGNLKMSYTGKCSSKEFNGWVLCEDAAFSRIFNKIIITNSSTIETPCFQYQVKILHPGGFTAVRHDYIEANAIHLSCPKESFYIVSPYGFKVKLHEGGKIDVEPNGIAVIGLGGRLDAVKSLASLVPPKVDNAWSLIRGGSLCIVSYSSDREIRISAWNPVESDSFCEILFQARVTKVKVIDPIGEVDIEAEKGLVRVPLPGYMWVIVEASKDVKLAERLKRLRNLKAANTD
jgi:hypothetical protein